MKNAHRKERTIRRIPPSSGSEVALDDTNTSEPTPPLDQESATQRLSMPVTSDGRIDVSRLREKSKSALRQALSDPALPVALGITSTDSPAVDAETVMMMRQITSSLFTGVSALSVAFAMRSGYPPHAAAVMGWNDHDVSAVSPMASKVIQKRVLPLVSEEYRDEAILAYQVVSIIAGKIMMMREAATHPAPQETRPHAQPPAEETA